MGRFNIAKELVETFVQLTGLRLEAWMAPAFFLVIGALLFPAIRRSHRTSKARKRVRLIPYRRMAERQALADEALALVEGNPAGQLALAQEALRLGRKDLARRFHEALEGSGRYPAERAKLARELQDPAGHSALEATAAIERLVREGLLDEARRRLVLAQQRWPELEGWPEIPNTEEPRP
jgi:signal transduction histidine kinase